MSDYQMAFPRLRIPVSEVPAPPKISVGNWPLSRILQIVGYVGVMIVAMQTLPAPINHWVPLILFGVTAVTTTIVQRYQDASLDFLESRCDLTFPKVEFRTIFPLPPDIEMPRRVYRYPEPFDPIGVIA
jgi:hypothetical protein